MWIGTLRNIDVPLTTFTASCQLCHCKQQSQKAIQKGNPLRLLTAKQLITRLKNFRIWKRNLRSLKRKKRPSGSLKILGKSSVGKMCGQRFNEKCLAMIAELQSNIDQTQKGPKRKTQENVSYLQKEHSSLKREEWKKIKQKLGSDAVKEQRTIVRECSPQSVTHHLMVKL